MRKIELALQHSGYQTLNITYPSNKLDLEGIVEFIDKQIKAYSAHPTKIHFVGYSLGGLVIRAYLNKHKLKNLGNVVMAGTPNNGSEAADKFKHLWLFKKLIGPVGQQIATDQAKFRHLLGKVHYHLGVIAGNKAIDPINSRLIPKPNDGKVSVQSTKLEGMSDHIIIPINHTFMLRSNKVIHQICYFIKNGKFDRIFNA